MFWSSLRMRTARTARTDELRGYWPTERISRTIWGRTSASKWVGSSGKA